MVVPAQGGAAGRENDLLLPQPLHPVEHAVRPFPGGMHPQPQPPQLGNGFGLRAVTGDAAKGLVRPQPFPQLQIGQPLLAKLLQHVNTPGFPIVSQQHEPAWIGREAKVQPHPGFAVCIRRNIRNAPVAEDRIPHGAPVAQGVDLIEVRIPLVFQGGAILRGQKAVIPVGGFQDGYVPLSAFPLIVPPDGKKLLVEPMPLMHRIKRQGEPLPMAALSPQALIQLLEIPPGAFRGFLHPDIRQRPPGRGDGFDLLRVIQSRK